MDISESINCSILKCQIIQNFPECQLDHYIVVIVCRCVHHAQVDNTVMTLRHRQKTVQLATTVWVVKMPAYHAHLDTIVLRKTLTQSSVQLEHTVINP